ncbi:MAG: hypothetical protein ACON5H_09725 [Akkermansiaceae bacterium]
MNKLLILLLSGGYLLFLGWIPDPLPFLDEGVALAFFIKTLKDLISERGERRTGSSAAQNEDGPIIDID